MIKWVNEVKKFLWKQCFGMAFLIVSKVNFGGSSGKLLAGLFLSKIPAAYGSYY